MKSTKILIVDDREVNRYLRGETLKKAGYAILETETGRAAIDLVTREKPDLLLLDIHLPDLSGHEVCRMVKSDPKTADVMVLQVSASAIELSDEVLGLEGGADGYLIEPVEPELLVAKVRSLLRLRAAEERLRQSNARLREFAQVASHDLREPLRTVTLFAELFERDYASSLDSRAKEYLKHILNGGQRMSHLISDLLEYAQVTTEAGDLEEHVALENVIASILAVSENRIAAAQARVTHDPLPQIEGNRLRITQLFQNLLDNSLKYSRPEEPPVIHISAKFQLSNWLFSVRDNGQGFPQEMAEQIFGVFKRLHSPKVPGSGLGLAICKAVVEQHGGQIWAEGSPESGATFFFTWPVANSSGAHTSGVSTQTPA